MNLNNIPKDKFLLIAGPCVIESEEVSFKIAEELIAITSKLDLPLIFKGSYKKANRTKLDSFSGIGDVKALEILKKINQEFKVPDITDIHEKGEAQIASEYEDVLQIPAFLARQTELLVAAAKTGKTVNIHDAYQEEGFDFSGTRAYDARSGYHSQSFLFFGVICC